MSAQSVAVVAVYFGMLLFDAFIMAGAAYLVARHEWSAWWVLAAIFVCAGSNPARAIKAITGCQV